MDDEAGFAAHYGHWGLVAIMIVAASWILYRFAAPKRWREWTGAGLVQAFIIALYAEMYGFPLTIYLLSGFFGLDITRTSFTGHLWATLLGYGEMGAILEMLIGGVFVVLGLAMLAFGWREVYLARRDDQLADDGLYSAIRHPQYVGIMLAVFGQVVHWPTVATLALFPAIVFAYVRLARKEEREMSGRFGPVWKEYARRVPMFVPRLDHWSVLLNPLRW